MRLWQKIVYGSFLLICIRLIFVNQFSGSLSTPQSAELNYAPNFEYIDSVFRSTSKLAPFETLSKEDSVSESIKARGVNVDDRSNLIVPSVSSIIEASAEMHHHINPTNDIPTADSSNNPLPSKVDMKSMISENSKSSSYQSSSPKIRKQAHGKSPSLTSSSRDMTSCDAEKVTQQADWVRARQAHYITHNFPKNATQLDMAPLWKHSSVVTGPDFGCDDLVQAEQKTSRLKRPSWDACALLCGDAECTRARKQCALMHECRGVALAPDKYKGLGILKGDYVWTGLKDGKRLKANAMEECMRITNAARGKANWKSSEDARSIWNQYGCQDYARPHWDSVFSGATDAVSEWGGLQESLSLASKSCRACPQHVTSGGGGGGALYSETLGAVYIIVVTDRPSTSLCLFTNSALWKDINFIVLGWSPTSAPRWQEWYLGSKPMMIAEYLGKCQLTEGSSHGISPDSTVIVTDSDVLINSNPTELMASLESYAEDIKNDQVVFSAEGPCVTVNQHYRKALCASFETRSQREGNAPNGLASLNSGLWVGKAKNLRRIARRFYQATKKYLPIIKHPKAMSDVQALMTEAMKIGDEITAQLDPSGIPGEGGSKSVEASRLLEALATVKRDHDEEDFDDFSHIMRIRSQYKSELQSTQDPIHAFSSTAFLVNDQSVYYLMMTVEDKAVHGISLDYNAKLFLNMYGSPNRLSLHINNKEHRLYNKGPKATHSLQAHAPVFVHYNGGAKLSKWNVEINRATLHRSLLEGWREARSPKPPSGTVTSSSLSSEERIEMEALMRKHVLVVDTGFRAVQVAYSDVCSV